MTGVPFLIVGDAPEQPTGLGRILRELTGRLRADQETLNLDVRTCCWTPWTGLPTQGIQVNAPTHEWRFADVSHWGREAITVAWRTWYGDRPGILFTIWDPSRCYEFLDLDLPVRKWGYFAVDGANWEGRFGGPASAAVVRGVRPSARVHAVWRGRPWTGVGR